MTQDQAMMRFRSPALVLCVAGLLSLTTTTTAQSDFLADATAGNNHVEVTLQIPSPVFSKIPGGDEVTVHDFGRYAEPGTPRVPGRIFSIAIPPGARVTNVTIEPLETIPLPGSYSIPPTPLPRMISVEDRSLPQSEIDRHAANLDAVYGRDDLYPGNAGHLVRTAGYRKYDLVDVRVTPVSWRPKSGTLVYHPRVAVRVDFVPAADSSTAFRPDHLVRTERVAREIVLNYDQAQKWYGGPPRNVQRGLYDFVIITLDSLTSTVQPLVAWETTKGRNVNVVTTTWIASNYTGYDTAEKIRNFLRDKYPSSEWGIEDVLFVGHYDDVVMRRCEQDLGYGKPETDYYYAELSLPDSQSWDADGDHRWGEDSDPIDFYNEINVGRIPWSGAAAVAAICNKSVAFENNSDPSFKKNILLLGSYFWSDTDNAVLMETKVDQPWMFDWTMTRMYEQGYSSYPMDYNLTYTNARSVWGAGKYAFVNWAGHGSPTSAHIMYNGSPAFVDTATCVALNDNYPSIIFADACSNADTDYDNVCRAMLRQGGIGVLGATKVALGQPGWSSANSGSSQSLDYYFTISVTSTDYTIGQGHQRALREMYTRGLWSYDRYETFEWGALLGNPDLGLAEAAAVQVSFPNDLPEGCLPPGPALAVTVEIRDGLEVYVPGSGLLSYRLDPTDAYSSVALTPLGGDLYEAVLPHTRPGDLPEFYFSADGNGGSTVHQPYDAPTDVYSFELGFENVAIEENFDTNPGWTTTGQWAWGTPTGGGGEYGNPDPTSGHTGSKVYGYNLSGDYPNDMPEYHLTSPAFDFSAISGAELKFWRWLNVEQPAYDHAKLRISTNGISYTTLWENSGEVADSSWSQVSHDISAIADGHSSVYLRWTMGTTDGGWRYSGWNIDDVSVVGIDHDPTLWAEQYEISVSTGGSTDLVLGAGVAHAGELYVVAGSLSGTEPGFDYNGLHIPLNWDQFTSWTMQLAGTPYFADFVGTLDGQGDARATFDTRGPLDISWIGREADFVFVTLPLSGFVSNPVTVTFGS
jgi:hypothetical protein